MFCSGKCMGEARPRTGLGIPKVDWVEVQCPCGKAWLVPPWKKKHYDKANSRFYCSAEHNLKYKKKGTGRPPAGNKWTKDGYVSVYVPPEERWWTTKRTSAKEHQVIMRQMLGRDLLPGENVHHKNGNGLDNRPENLELWFEKQPKGQRVADLLVWAREIIARYEGVEDVI